MADYWKSQAKKFCDFCKCWIADNKPSVEFHEKGKRHKENVQKRLYDITKRSMKDHKERLQVDVEMRKMEEAAMKAYMKDVESCADYTSKMVKEQLDSQKEKKAEESASLVKQQLASQREKKAARKAALVKEELESEVKKTESDNVALPSESSSESDEKDEGESTSNEESSESKAKNWYEATSGEGHTYYWNTETGESKWEPPEEGFVSILEQKSEEKKAAECETKLKQEKIENQEDTEEVKLSDTEVKVETETDDSEDEIPPELLIGPAPKPDPYGAWKTVKTKTTKPIDLQLPEQEYIEIKVPVLSEEPQIKFKEKKIQSLCGQGEEEASFKKRKINLKQKRNMRRRLDDDDDD